MPTASSSPSFQTPQHESGRSPGSDSTLQVLNSRHCQQTAIAVRNRRCVPVMTHMSDRLHLSCAWGQGSRTAVPAQHCPAFDAPSAADFNRWFPGLAASKTAAAAPRLRILCFPNAGNAEDMYTSEGTGIRRASSPLLVRVMAIRV